MISAPDSTTPFADVVIVPDFCSEGPAFESRTLLFLASWIETGSAREAALTLACVGYPPQSVQAMAEYAGARTEIFEPSALPIGAFANKLRGFETKAFAPNLLLLDVDTCLLQAPHWTELHKHRISIMPAGLPLITEGDWRRVYKVLNIEMPENRILSKIYEFFGDKALSFVPEDVRDQLMEMVPYYNSGSIWIPHSSRLPEVWSRHTSCIHKAFQNDTTIKRNVPYSDQISLATALQEVIAIGEVFEPLPVSWNGIMMALKSGAIEYEDIIVLHMIGSLRGPTRPAGLLEELDRYLARQKPQITPEIHIRLSDYFTKLFECHIAPILD
jgi:hypothetical protein